MSENNESSELECDEYFFVNPTYEHNLIQLDGDVSMLSSSISSATTGSSFSSLPHVLNPSSSLPRIYSANARSVFPKFRDLVLKLQNLRIDIAQISETWQDVNKADHNDKIDNLKERIGYDWYSYARAKYRDNGCLTGGGGTAILVNRRYWLSQHLNDVIVPQGVEVVWVKAAPISKSTIKIRIIL